MNDLSERVASKIKEYFPFAEFKLPQIEYEKIVAMSYGLPIRNDQYFTEYDFFHNVFGGAEESDIDSACNGLISELSQLRFYKAPEIVLVRHISVQDRTEFSDNQKFFQAVARFSLGYKLCDTQTHNATGN